MRILLIHQYFLEEDDPGGSRFNEMTKSWIQEGHEVTVLAGMMHANGTQKRKEYRGKYIVKKQQGDVVVIRSHVSESYNTNFLGRLWGYLSFVFSSLWAGLTSIKSKPDVILVTSPPLFVGITAFLLSLFKKRPFVFEVRDLWPESAIDTGVVTNPWLIKLAFAFEKFIYRKAKLINVLTPAFRKTLVEQKSIPESKVIFIPNAADFTLAEKVAQGFDAKQFRKELGWEDKFVITYVGAHGVANHLIQLLEAAEKMKETNAHFVLIGNGMQKPMLKEEARKKGLMNVQFIDSVPKAEVFRYILASDMGASVLKKVDTFKTIYSNKTFDYMSCKKPVFLCIDGVSRELVETANCGVYAEPENSTDIAQKVKDCISNQEALPQMGMNGYHYAKQNFDRQLLASEYLEHIKTIAYQKAN
jgi:glycosyltransferase involved in cell wall biosynthesis